VHFVSDDACTEPTFSPHGEHGLESKRARQTDGGWGWAVAIRAPWGTSIWPVAAVRIMASCRTDDALDHVTGCGGYSSDLNREHQRKAL
jgi:hypothetical protein